MKDVKKIKLPTTHEEWLANRTKGIGGSDAGAILGLNKYKSPYTLWCEKTGRIHREIDNEQMREGRDLEEYVARRFTEQTGKKVHKSGYSFQSVKHPCMLANVDRLVVGENAGLECKTTNALTRTKYDKGDIPASYYAQCVHYLAVTGLDKWYIAILVMGKGFYVYEINRDENEIQSLIESEEQFWQLVETDTPPEVDGTDSTTDSLSYIYAGNGEELADFDGMSNDLQAYLALKESIKSATETKKMYENKFKEKMKDCNYGYLDDYKLSWKPSERESVDTKKLKKEFPDVYEQCKKTITSRRFLVSKAKEREDD